MVTVYHFRVYDPANDATIVQPRKSTAERIERIRGEIIPGTAEEVDPSTLDEDGRYNPPSRGP
jgi:hypothetical protein